MTKARPTFNAGALLVSLSLLALGCPGQGTLPPEVPKATAKKSEPVVWRASKSGLGFRLSDAAPEEAAHPNAAQAAMLSEADTKKLLGRLPPLATDEGDVKNFAFRDRSRPAPRAGKTVEHAFPPPAGGPPPVSVPSSTPLTVTRRTPEGEVAVAPSLDVSFSKPMIAVTSHDDLAKAPPPVTLVPEPPGKWRWLGSQTVVFDPALTRFPKSTDYKVEVRAGTRAADGSALARPEVWTFSTPTVVLDARHPNGSDSVELEPIMFAGFDQSIDPATMLSVMKVTAGKATVPVKLLAAEELEGNATVRSYAKSHEAKAGEPPRFIAFKPQSPLPKATHVQITFPEGTPSAEGPKKTTKPQTFGFNTYGPMAVRRTHCNWGSCAPLSPFVFEFTNAIDTSSFDKALVRVSPELIGMKVDVSGNTLTVRGRSKGRTQYVVTVGGALRDRFGQTLDRDVSANFDVGRAEPTLFSEDAPQIVLDPADTSNLTAAAAGASGKGAPGFSVFSVNRDALRVRLYQVKPDDWGRYLKWRQAWDYDGKDTTPPGKLMSSTVVKTRKAADELVETQVSLGAALTGGFGQILAIVENTTPPKRDHQREWVRQWIQVTSIGLDVFADSQKLFAWTSALSNGAPIEGAEIALLTAPNAPFMKTGEGGVARMDLGDGSGKMLIARKGADLAMLSDRYDDELGISRRSPPDGTRWFTYDDRRMYKPGEEIHVKGWVRNVKSGIGGDLAKIAGASRVSWQADDPRGSKIISGTADLDATGGFDFAFKLAKDVNLGQGSVRLTLDRGASTGHHSFSIQEFRRPEFEVNVATSGGPHLVGGHAVATVAAKYYAGGGLPAAETAWVVRGKTASFTPPNLGGFAFGKPPEPWWWRTPRDLKPSDKPDKETWTARTSAAGEHRLRVDFDAVDPPYPLSIDLEASVTDVNRQEWTARGSLLVHPAEITAGIRAQRAFVRAGEAITVEAIASDLEGNLVAGSTIAIKSARLDTEWTVEGTKVREVEEQTCALTSGKEAVRCTLPTKRGGQHAVTAVVSDVHGRKSQSRFFVWVADDNTPVGRELARDKVEIMADKKSYKPGETAELLLLAPFAPAEGVITLQRQGIVHFERFSLTKTSQVVRVKLDGSHLPSVVARVDLVGAAPRDNLAGEPDPTLPKRPAFAQGTTTLDVPPAERTLAITAKPREAKVDPASETVIDVDVKDAAGRPAAGAVVAVAVVDESILALSGAKLPDPIATFYSQRSADTSSWRTRDLVWLPKPKLQQLAVAEGSEKSKDKSDSSGFGSGHGRLGGSASAPKPVMMEAKASVSRAMAAPAASAAPRKKAAAPGADLARNSDDESSAAQTPLSLRKDFAALAAWMPRVVVDGDGRAQVKVKLPESLTRFRVVAVGAASENWFGAGESTITVRLPLMVRPSATRFLNYGDRLELPIVLQNQTNAPLDVLVGARASNARMLDTGGRRVVVPANDRVEVRVPVAAEKPGTARFQFAASSGKVGDAAALELPVWTPATSEAFATYGTIDEGAVAQPVRFPNGVVKEFGALEITTSSTGLQGLTDAVLYLQRYPFDCNEQIASRVLAIAALRDVLGAFNTGALPKPEVLAKGVTADLEKLATRQHYSGGFSFWGPNYEPYAWVSIHVAHAIQRAKSKGYVVPGALESRALQFLKNVERYIPRWYPASSRQAIIAYALYVRHRFADIDVARAKSLVKEAGGVEKLPLEVVGWLLPIMGPDATSQTDVTAMRRLLANRVTETAGAAHFVTSYGDGAHVLLHSDRRADGVLLEALIGDQKDSDLIPKLVTGLLGHRKAGRWSSTQENAFILLALDRYFQTYEKVTPNFVGRAWVGEQLALEQNFQGRSTDRQHTAVPLSVLADLVTPRAPGGSTNVVLQKDGAGRLYYRVGMTYAPTDLRPPPAEHGFSVSRTYEGVDSPKDVTRDPDGTYRMKSGAKVRVRVNMVAPARRHHVALVDPLPAGLEPMNPALATSGTIPEDPASAKPTRGGMPWWWSRTWYEHQNMRDERVEAFASLLYDGVYEYTYVARATTPGIFVAPPPKAEEMYSPETFGRGPGDRVIVE